MESPREAIDNIWDLIGKGDVRIKFWSCPMNHPRTVRPTIVTVEWDGDVAHCTQCPMTSELHRAHLAWSMEEA